MLTKEQAHALIVAEINRSQKDDDAGTPIALAIVDEHTIERPWGWVFFYNSRRFVETRDFRHALAGNAPYIVNRHTGEIRLTGTAHKIEYYIAHYERSLADPAPP